MLQALETKEHGRPLALASVIVSLQAFLQIKMGAQESLQRYLTVLLQDEAVSLGLMMPLERFQSNPYSIYDRRWRIQPTWMLSWIARQLGFWDSIGGGPADGKLPTARYATIPNLEEASDKISKAQAPKTNLVDRIYSLDSFRQFATETLNLPDNEPLSANDTSLLLTFLSRDKHHLAYSPTTQTIKFLLPATSSSHPSKSADQLLITPQDTTISSLKTLLTSLHSQTATLTTRISLLTTRTRSALESSNKASALAYLKSKKLVERALSQRLDTLTQLEEVYTSIEQAADQVEIVRVMEGSRDVLRGLQKQTGGVDKVEDVVEGLREEMRGVEEMGEVIAQGGGGVVEGVVDDGELDEELEGMEREEREERERKEEKVREKEEREAMAKSDSKMEEQKKIEEQQQQQQKREEKERELEERARKFAIPITQQQDAETDAEADADPEAELDGLTRTATRLSLEAKPNEQPAEQQLDQNQGLKRSEGNDSETRQQQQREERTAIAE